MNNELKMKTKVITECAVMIALATVLSFIKVFEAPYGGSVTLGSMVPIVVLCAHIRETRWALLACFAYALVQMLFGFYPPPTATVWAFAGVVLLDYIVAFGVLFIVNPIAKLFKKKTFAVIIGASIAVFCRFLCHFATGILIWDACAPEGQPVWLYSLLYNGGYMLPELLITVVLSALIYAIMLKRKK